MEFYNTVPLLRQKLELNPNKLPAVRFHVSHKGAKGQVNGSAEWTCANNKVTFTTATGIAMFSTFEKFTSDSSVAPADGRWRVVVSTIDTANFRTSCVGNTMVVTFYEGPELCRRPMKISSDTLRAHWTIMKAESTGTELAKRAPGQQTDIILKHQTAWENLAKLLNDALKKIQAVESGTAPQGLNYTETFSNADEWKTFAYFKSTQATSGILQLEQLFPHAKEWCCNVAKSGGNSSLADSFNGFIALCRSTNAIIKFVSFALMMVDKQLTTKTLSKTIEDELNKALYSPETLSNHLRNALRLHRQNVLQAGSLDMTCRFNNDICEVITSACNKDEKAEQLKFKKAVFHVHETYLKEEVGNFSKTIVQRYLEGSMDGVECVSRWIQFVMTEKVVAERLGVNLQTATATTGNDQKKKPFLDILKDALCKKELVSKLLTNYGTEWQRELSEVGTVDYRSFAKSHASNEKIRCIILLAAFAGKNGLQSITHFLNPALAKNFPSGNAPNVQDLTESLRQADQLRFSVEKFLHWEAVLKADKAKEDEQWGSIYNRMLELYPRSSAEGSLLWRGLWKKYAEEALNKSPDHSRSYGGMIAAYIDDVCTKDLDTFTHLKEGTLELFSLVTDKEVMKLELGAKFARKLLRSEDGKLTDQQDILFNNITQREGSQFTRNISQMLTDLSQSRELLNGFNAFDQHAHRLVVHVLTFSAWPGNVAGKPTDSPIPQLLEARQEVFSRWYGNKFGTRVLKWSTNPLYTYAKIKLQVPGAAALKLDVPLGMAALLLKLVEVGTLPQDDALVTDDVFKPLSAKRILGKTKAGVVAIVASEIRKMTVRSFSFLPKEQKVRDTTDTEVDQSKKFQVSAAIVKVMKSKRTLTHGELSATVAELLVRRFTMTNEMFKQGVDYVIDQEFMKRDDDTRSTYHYLA